MAATQLDITVWWQTGKQEHATHMIIVCDTFDWSDYPVYAFSLEEAKTIVAHYPKEHALQKLLEVYSYTLPLKSQLQEYRAWHLIG